MSYLIRSTYPENIVNIKDESAGQRVDNYTLPAHCPFIPIRAAQGDDKIEWLNGNQALEKYGDQTFDRFSKFWRNEQLLAMEKILPYQAAYFKRIVPLDAKISTLLVEGHLETDIDVPQYQRDENNRYIYSADTGNPIPETDASGNPVTLKGTRRKFKLRPLTDEEMLNGIDNIPVRTVMLNNKEVRIYPLVSVKAKSAGELGNKMGIRLYVDQYKQTLDLQEVTESLIWTFVPLSQRYNSNVAAVIRNQFEATVNEMVMRDDQVDPFTVRRISPYDTIERCFFIKNTNKHLLPYDIHFYTENFGEMGEVIGSYETMNTTFSTGWMVNIAGLTDANDAPYYTAIADTTDVDAVSLAKLQTHYLLGGSDGDTSDEAFEEGIRRLMYLESDPEIIDRFHYLITHIYDVGYSLETKFALLDFMADHRYVKVAMSSQDINRHLYTMDEAVSVAAALYGRAAITPESELYGTQAMRATIFANSGYIYDTTIKDIIPMTIWQAGVRSKFHGTSQVTGSFAADPHNVVADYKQLNFIPYTGTQKQILWDGAANYVQWKDGRSLFMPSCRSIYKDTTSLLSDDEFTDACVYMMYLTDKVWTRHVSRKLPFAKLSQIISEDIDSMAYRMFGSLYTVYSNVYLSEEDMSNNDSLSIDIGLEGDYPKRIWNTTIIARGRSATTGA